MILYKTFSVRIIAHFGKRGELKIYKKNPATVSNVDGLVVHIDIAEHFRSKSSEVSFTTVVFDNMCKTACSESLTDYIFDVRMVDRVIYTCLRCGEVPGIHSLTTEHFVTAHPSVFVHLTRLFNLILKHDYVPNAFGEGRVVPIIKDKHGDICSSDNCRVLQLVSHIVSKIFLKLYFA